MLDPNTISEARLKRGSLSPTLFGEQKAGENRSYNALWLVWGCDSTFMVGPYAILLYDLTTEYSAGEVDLVMVKATHEVAAFAVEPAQPLPTILGPPPWDPLPLRYPALHVYQFKAINDRAACDIVANLVGKIERLDIYADRGSSVAAEQWDHHFKYGVFNGLRTGDGYIRATLRGRSTAD